MSCGIVLLLYPFAGEHPAGRAAHAAQAKKMHITPSLVAQYKKGQLRVFEDGGLYEFS
jgi:hypothetical protein